MKLDGRRRGRHKHRCADPACGGRRGVAAWVEARAAPRVGEAAWLLLRRRAPFCEKLPAPSTRKTSTLERTEWLPEVAIRSSLQELCFFCSLFPRSLSQEARRTRLVRNEAAGARGELELTTSWREFRARAGSLLRMGSCAAREAETSRGRAGRGDRGTS